MKEYLSRLVDQVLEKRLASMGAVLMEGPRFCGKTTTAKRLAKVSLALDRPDKIEHYRALAAIAPEQLWQEKPPVLLDEWETVPELWAAVCQELESGEKGEKEGTEKKAGAEKKVGTEKKAGTENKEGTENKTGKEEKADKAKKGGPEGRFILTRSFARTDVDSALSSRFEKIDRIVIRPMSLFESQESSGSISLKALFEGGAEQAKLVANTTVNSTANSTANSTTNLTANLTTNSTTNSTTLDDIAFFICRGGWPHALGMAPRSALQQAKKYITSLVEADLSQVDGVQRKPAKARSLLASYARQVGTASSLETIRKESLRSTQDTFDPVTLYAYLAALERTFTVEDLPAWQPQLRFQADIKMSSRESSQADVVTSSQESSQEDVNTSFQKSSQADVDTSSQIGSQASAQRGIRTTPVRYFVDPSLATAALRLTPRDLMNDLVRMGFLFKNLCIRDLRVYAETLDAGLYQYRDRTGLACDAVLQRRNGSYGLIQVCLGGDRAINEAAQILHRLLAKLDIQNTQNPAFLAVLCAIAPSAYQREDGIWVLPVTNLGP